jgi:hypothetical protein
MKHPNPGRLPKTLAAVFPELTPRMGGVGPHYLDSCARRGR